MPSGSYTYTVTSVYNSWTNSALSSEVTVVSTPPSASAPGVSASVNHGTNPYWVDREDVTLTDITAANGGPAVTSVSYYYCPVSSAPCTSSNWTFIGNSTGGGNWAVPWASGSLPSDGIYDVVAIATNAASLTSPTSAASEVGVDTTGPIVSAPSVAAAVTYGGNPTFVSNEDVTLTDAPVSDAGSGTETVAYYYCAGSSGACSTVLIGSSSTASGNYAVSWSNPLPADGPYRIEAVAADYVTNATTSVATLVTVDTTPPTVSAPSVNGIS